MKTLFIKIKDYLLESNHYKHLICGSIYGLIFLIVTLFTILVCGINSIFAAYILTLISTCGLALTWEANDKRHGRVFDLEDASMTVLGCLIVLLLLLPILI